MRPLGALALGTRLALAGGRAVLARTALIAIGVALCVALLLGAASVPHAVRAGQARDEARQPQGAPVPAGRALLLATTDTPFRDAEVRGRLVEAEGPRAPLPPGVRAALRPGITVVSPALADLLATRDGARLLRPRIPGRISGKIADAGLRGPDELAYYAGTDVLRVRGRSVAERVGGFGYPLARTPLSPLLVVLAIVACCALLMPVVTLIAVAVRFGGEARDRRLAAIRLLGADRTMTGWLAVGETLAAAALGLAGGIALFFAARPLAGHLPFGLAVFAADVRPVPALAVLVLTAVPVLAALTALAALRRVVAEPLGVVRRGPTRAPHLGWRLAPVGLGLLLLLSIRGTLLRGHGVDTPRVAAGVLLTLAGVTALIPWLTRVLAGRISGPGLAFGLAIRRLRLDGGTAARAVSGVAVAVAGAIALQTLFAAAEGRYTYPTGARVSSVSATATVTGPAAKAARVAAAMRHVGGVRTVDVLLRASIMGHGAQGDVVVADCAALRHYAGVPGCRPGAVFTVRGGSARLRGRTISVGEDERRANWTVPASARAIPAVRAVTGETLNGVLATPEALSPRGVPDPVYELEVQIAPHAPDALERVRTAAALVDPLISVSALSPVRIDRSFVHVRRAIAVVAAAVLALIGVSLLVGALEGIADRRRTLAALAAVGTPLRTLALAVLWQTALPIALGLVIALLAGSALGVALLAVVGEGPSLDMPMALAAAAAGAVVTLAVTALTLPALRRSLHPGGLRTE